MRDKFFVGAISGVIGALTMSLINFFINLIPGVYVELIFGVSKLFVPNSLAGTLQGSIIGLIAHIVCGMIVGIAFLIVLETFGYDHLLVKGTILGLASWFIMCGIVGRLLNLGMQDKFLDIILFILIHIPFGITTVWMINRLRRMEMTP